MKIMLIVFGLILSVQSAFGGWFSKSLVERKALEGKEIFISSDSDYGTDYFIFFDNDFSNHRNKADYYEKMKHRMTLVFNEINDFGKKKGYKSFVLLNQGTSFYEGFPLNDTEQLIELCMLQGLSDKKKYGSFCTGPGGGNALMRNTAEEIRAEVLFFKESNLNYFPIK